MVNLSAEGKDRVVITDVRIPFWSMVWLLFKAALASIPATILLSALGFLLWMILGTFAAALQYNIEKNREAAAEASPTPIRSAVIEPTPTPRIIREVIMATPEPTPTPEKICYENGVRIVCPE